MREHHALGTAGGARRVGKQSEVVGATARDFLREIIGVVGRKRASGRLDVGEGFEIGLAVLPHAERVVIDQKAKSRQPLLEEKDLVDLLLVLGDDDRNLGVLEHVDELGGDRILIDRHCHAAEALGS